MNTHVFLITAKTNLHVGNENGNDFTIIDKAIQRDPLTSLPCINSSSLKGAINEFCSHAINMPAEVRKRLFGSDKIDKKGDNQKGEAIFFDAKLLFLPQQDDQTLFHFVTTQGLIDMMNERAKLFTPAFNYQIPSQYNAKAVTVITDEAMKACASDDNLPIIARNVLDNGESKNLWYEQVLPTESVLYTIIRENGDELASALDNQIVQIGANATIGYGYCKFKLMK